MKTLAMTTLIIIHQRKMLFSAPGENILHGEHSVVYGKTADACSRRGYIGGRMR